MCLHPKLDEDFLTTSTNSPASASQARKLQLIYRLLDVSKLTLNELFRDIYVHAAALRFGPSQPTRSGGDGFHWLWLEDDGRLEGPCLGVIRSSLPLFWLLAHPTGHGMSKVSCDQARRRSVPRFSNLHPFLSAATSHPLLLASTINRLSSLHQKSY
jgi:hypothetical protein